MVKGVKRALKAGMATMRQQDEDAWETLISKVNFMINSRPLDKSYWTDLQQAPISANDILFPYLRRRLVPDCPDSAREEVESAVDSFWAEWRNQVPPELLSREKWFKSPQEWKKGDLVLIKRLQKGGLQSPRGMWPKGVVTETLPSKDGVTRKVTLRLASGKTTTAATPYLALLWREQ